MVNLKCAPTFLVLRSSTNWRDSKLLAPAVVFNQPAGPLSAGWSYLKSLVMALFASLMEGLFKYHNTNVHLKSNGVVNTVVWSFFMSCFILHIIFYIFPKASAVSTDPTVLPQLSGGGAEPGIWMWCAGVSTSRGVDTEDDQMMIRTEYHHEIGLREFITYIFGMCSL